MQKKIPYMDGLRVMSIFLMIMLHVCGYGYRYYPVNSSTWLVLNFFMSVTGVCIVMFVMISGALMLDKEITIKEMLKQRVVKLMMTFFIWSFLYACYEGLSGILLRGVAIDTKLAETFISNLMIGRYHLWFLYMMAALYLITPLLRLLTIKKDHFEYFLVLAFVFGSVWKLLALIPFLSNVLHSIGYMLHIDFVLGYSGVFMLGYYLHKYELSENVKKCIHGFALLSVAITFIGSSMISMHLHQVYMGLFTYTLPMYICLASSIFLLFKEHYGKISKGLQQSVSWIAPYCFGIYLVHDFFNVIFRRFTVPWMDKVTIVFVLGVSLLIFVLSFIVIYILKNTFKCKRAC